MSISMQGLVMEKKKNLLAAESYYLRAIKENSVHYLPFERLGNLYLNTGRFADANYYLYQAQTRKKDFAVNDKTFNYGVELGGMGWNEMGPRSKIGCPANCPQLVRLQMSTYNYSMASKSWMLLHRAGTP